ncbi:hypothetical protein WJX81_008544 [Elliptochloris bilobata]|uniref:PPPDE domain-containing protein n=1 Tax=Elliptochloris bilobata TaxID=381761 RepID=A0AAW1S9J6_9CHLO
MAAPSRGGRRSLPREQVVLNIYDLHDNSWLYHLGIGIFHSGVQIHGVEYAYGGHEYDMSGVFATAPRDAPGPVTWRESVVIGYTSLEPHEVQDVVQHLGYEFRGNSYHLLERNCNHFSEALCEKLTGERTPSWVNRLAGLAVMLHCILPSALGLPPLLTTPSVKPAVVTEERQTLLREGMREGRSGSAVLTDERHILLREACPARDPAKVQASCLG